MSNRSRNILAAIVVIIIICLICRDCSCNKMYDTKSTITVLESRTKQLSERSDSISKNIKPLKDTVIVYRDRWHKTKKEVDTVFVGCDSTGAANARKQLKKVIADCDTTQSKILAVVAEQDKKIKADSLLKTVFTAVIDRKNAAISDTTKYFRKEVRRGKVRSFLKGFGLGFAVGAVARELKP